MRYIVLLLLSVVTLSISSCRNDFEFEPSTGGLEFSKDIVYLDTVFTNIGSSTYTLKVYNRSDKDISIPSIKLARPDSKYRLMVDGMPGTSFTNVELMAKDSMFVFIETTASIADANPDDFLYTDQIQFTSMNGVQSVDLVTLIQDAVFIFPNRPLETGIKETLVVNGMPSDIEGHELTDEELNWTDEKPYVVYGYALVPNGKVLNIDPGARVHFHAESGLIVDKAGELHINGDVSTTEELENEVIFEGDRLEPGFSDVNGQWFGILSFSETAGNLINHLTLKNAIYGILLQRVDMTQDGTPKLTINNSQLYNCSAFGMLAIHANVNSQNLVANNCGQASVGLVQGGTYHFKHATLANYFNAFNQVPLVVNDYFDYDGIRYISSLSATFDNSIMWGSNSYGISLENVVFDEALDPLLTFNVTFNKCLIKLFDSSGQLEDKGLYPFDDNDPVRASYVNSIISEDSNDPKPDFRDPNKNDLRLGDDNEVNDLGFEAGVTVDVLGLARTSPPDLGAYEYTPE